MASTGHHTDIQSIILMVKSLTNAQLKAILRNENLAVSGVKLSLQSRIIDHAENLIRCGQNERVDRLFKTLFATAAHHTLPSTPTQTPPPHQNQSQSTPQSSSTHNRPYLALSQPFSNGRLTFKDSPFYTILEPLTSTVECKVRESTRDSVELKVILNHNAATKLQSDQNIRVMVFCAADTGLNQFAKSDIAFPNQVELKTNYDDVKANLKGLKNKPGSTRPADITNYIRKKPGYPNNVAMTYALTQRKFFVLVNLVKRRPVDELVAELKARQTISKEQVLREMRSRADDVDIVATSSVMSLKCPLSTLRIDVPCRSVICAHNQCFDASSFLQLQEQAPTWTCPVCNKSTSFESLQIDQYVDDILHTTPSEVEQVTIEPSGHWYNPMSEKTSTNDSLTPNTDDDLVEIKRPDTSPLKRDGCIIPQRTPASREPSAVSSSTRLSSNKRPAPQIIDLTGSDEEDVTSRPTKRLAFDSSVGVSRRDGFEDSIGSNGTDIPCLGLPRQSNAESSRGASQY